METETCLNCNAKVKKGILKSNAILTQDQTEIINKFLRLESQQYCAKCGNPEMKKIITKINNEIAELSSMLSSNSHHIPILSTHTPLNWEYDSKEIVTAQTTTGTGVFADFTSSFTDFFGEQSGTYNKKIANGERLCFAQLRAKAISLGCNAVIATDIDYSEVGSGKGMLLVCMAGTAIKLKNVEVLGPGKAKISAEISQAMTRIQYLKAIKKTLESSSAN